MNLKTALGINSAITAVTTNLGTFLYECWLPRTLKCAWNIGVQNKAIRAKFGIQHPVLYQLLLSKYLHEEQGQSLGHQSSKSPCLKMQPSFFFLM